MRTAEYLEKCKKKLDISSDYRLAKEWQLDDSSMSQYKSGKLKPDVYLCFKIAETLGISPAKLIAELESENTKNEVKSLYFKNFFSTVGLWIVLGFACLLYNPTTSNANEAGSRAVIDHNGSLYEATKPHQKRVLLLLSQNIQKQSTWR